MARHLRIGLFWALVFLIVALVLDGYGSPPVAALIGLAAGIVSSIVSQQLRQARDEDEASPDEQG